MLSINNLSNTVADKPILKGLSLAGSSGKGTDAAVSFTADGASGVAAMKAFQTTGLLPGAERVVATRNPEAYQEFVSARTVLENAMRTGVPFTIEAAKREVFTKSKELNRLFMDSNGWSLPEAKIDGVNYDEHTTGRSSSDSVGLKVGPLDLMHSVTERLWETQYRTGEGFHQFVGDAQCQRAKQGAKQIANAPKHHHHKGIDDISLPQIGPDIGELR